MTHHRQATKNKQQKTNTTKICSYIYSSSLSLCFISLAYLPDPKKRNSHPYLNKSTSPLPAQQRLLPPSLPRRSLLSRQIESLFPALNTGMNSLTSRVLGREREV